MESFKLKFDTLNHFSPLVLDYLSGSEKLSSFYNRFPSIDSFNEQIAEKSMQDVNRDLLFESLIKQNEKINLSELSKKNIHLLKNKNTYSITTGHQLCLFTGPLYFIYKIISTINLAERLKKEFPNKDFVPVFWMASEDHDFDEINHINLFGKQLKWESNQTGAVGRMHLENFDAILEKLYSILGSDFENSSKLFDMFSKAYQLSNIANATRFLINELFGKYGLVIIDGDDFNLKNQIESLIKKDVEKSELFDQLALTTANLSKLYKSQAHIRKINFFDLSNQERKRIEINKKIDLPIDCYSPNVITRPMYQESILPNLAYVGGGAEIAYWMQLKESFKKENIVFPILILRNSCTLVESTKKEKIDKLKISLQDIFASEDQLHKQYILKNVDELDFDFEKKEINKIYTRLLNKFPEKDIRSSIKAENKKNINSLEKLSKKLIRFEKQKHTQSLNQISKLKRMLFPNNNLQERYDNFIPYYLKYGDNFIKILKNELNPLDSRFVILTLKQ